MGTGGEIQRLKTSREHRSDEEPQKWRLLLLTWPHQAGTWESVMSPSWAVKPEETGKRQAAGAAVEPIVGPEVEGKGHRPRPSRLVAGRD